MAVSRRTIRRLRTVFVLALLMALLVLGSVFLSSAVLDQPVSGRNLVEAIVLGGLIGGLLAAYELLLVEGRYGGWIRRTHFALSLGLSAVVYLVIIASTILTYEAWVYGNDDPDTYMGFAIDHDLAVMLDVVSGTAMFSLLLFIVTMRRVVGGQELANILLGRYRRGIAEQRVFMFVDMEDSTRQTERLGDLGAYRLISMFFFDIDEAILDFEGRAHRYVGDEVVISWPLAQGLRNVNALRCFFAIEEIIERRASRYQAAFGVVPKFRAGLHCGPIIVGQSGDSRRQVALFGDTVNTTARLEKRSRELGCRLLASADYIERASLPDEFEASSLGNFQLRGRQQEIELFDVRRRPQPQQVLS